MLFGDYLLPQVRQRAQHSEFVEHLMGVLSAKNLKVCGTIFMASSLLVISKPHKGGRLLPNIVL